MIQKLEVFFLAIHIHTLNWIFDRLLKNIFKFAENCIRTSRDFSYTPYLHLHSLPNSVTFKFCCLIKPHYYVRSQLTLNHFFFISKVVFLEQSISNMNAHKSHQEIRIKKVTYSSNFCRPGYFFSNKLSGNSLYSGGVSSQYICLIGFGATGTLARNASSQAPI